MAIITIQPMSQKNISSVVELDRLCFGGLWNFQGYQRELESPNSDLLILVINQKNEEMKREVALKSSNSKSELTNYQSIIGIGCLW
ncbi:MAG: ribosomal-protein-alanine N-acetyltransferase RimI, partial [Okeania sp. SIO3C4]|nr:ribosomal-protein-alanine N-acetyltransferase RimI [Okeania sp. SIO3C4]